MSLHLHCVKVDSFTELKIITACGVAGRLTPRNDPKARRPAGTEKEKCANCGSRFFMRSDGKKVSAENVNRAFS